MKNIFRILILFLPFSFVNAQSADELLNNIQKKFEGTEDFIADFEQSMASSIDQYSYSLNGTLYYKKGNNFKIELKQRQIISDGHSVWNVDTKLNRVVISPFENELTAFSLDMFIFEYPDKCVISEITDSETGYKGLLLKSDNDENEFTEIKLFVDEYFVIKNIEIEDFNETKYLINLFNVRLNVKLDSGIFNFQSPKGMKIVDLR